MVTACALALAPAAAAQTASTVTRINTAKATIVAPTTLASSTGLNFGRIAARTTAGTVILNPATASCTTTGAILHVGLCTPAEFAGMGVRNMFVRIQIAGNTQLTGPGTAMLLDTMTLDPSPGLTLQNPGNGNGNGNQRYHINSATGIFIFRVGGTLHVGANQRAGIYSGTFDVQVQYN